MVCKVTGEPVLYVSPTIGREIVGFKPEESDLLLNFLHQHIRSLDFQARASWQPKTVVVWDQVSLTIMVCEEI